MKLSSALQNTLRRCRGYLFGANVSIEWLIHVSGNTDHKKLQIDIAFQEMRKEAICLFGLECCGISLWSQESAEVVVVNPGMWLETKQTLSIVSKNHISGTFVCSHYYRGPTGSDDGRRKLKLEVKEKGLLSSHGLLLLNNRKDLEEEV